MHAKLCILLFLSKILELCQMVCRLFFFLELFKMMLRLTPLFHVLLWTVKGKPTSLHYLHFLFLILRCGRFGQRQRNPCKDETSAFYGKREHMSICTCFSLREQHEIKKKVAGCYCFNTLWYFSFLSLLNQIL